ncbi:MAG: nucleoside recognition protein [Verrucomicrobia bacterium]|nr:nucleoside recognition protein [Verrucomicrobiota bacterium]
MLNYIWLGLILLAVLIGGAAGKMKEVTEGAVDGSKIAATMSIGLIGIMALWLGVMRLAEKSGLVLKLASGLRPVLRWLFPEVPVNHPAMGSMVMNISANMLGLSNAATPLGLRAMKDLETLNKHPGTATNAMCMFLAINTGSIQLLPMTAVALMASAGSVAPTAIIGTAFIATLFSSTAGIFAAKTLSKLRWFRVPKVESVASVDASGETVPTKPSEVIVETTAPIAPVSGWGQVVLWAFAAAFVYFFFLIAFPQWFGRPIPEDVQQQNQLVRCVNAISILAIPLILSFFPLYSSLRKIPVYEEFVEGAKEGFHVAIRIIPFLVTILVAITMFRNAGGIDMITDALRPVLNIVGFPPELVPLSLMRPLSGSGSIAILGDMINTLGPDHLFTRMAATILGSTETTFYVITLYFGSVAVRRTRHAVAAGLFADGVGIIASIIICRIVFAI